jgi:hypothetical protein
MLTQCSIVDISKLTPHLDDVWESGGIASSISGLDRGEWSASHPEQEPWYEEDRKPGGLQIYLGGCGEERNIYP